MGKRKSHIASGGSRLTGKGELTNRDRLFSRGGVEGCRKEGEQRYATCKKALPRGMDCAPSGLKKFCDLVGENTKYEELDWMAVYYKPKYAKRATNGRASQANISAASEKHILKKSKADEAL